MKRSHSLVSDLLKSNSENATVYKQHKLNADNKRKENTVYSNEHESTITIPLLHNLFEEILTRNVIERKEIVFLRKDRRIVQLNGFTVQHKEVSKINRLLAIEFGRLVMFPMTRTSATEELTYLPDHYFLSCSAVIRYILKDDTIDGGHFRISLEKHTLNGSYQLIGEVEYSDLLYSKVKDLECILLSDIISFIPTSFEHNDFAAFYDNFNEDELFLVSSRKFTPLCTGLLDSTNLYVKKKYDGYKAKVVSNSGGEIMYIDDLYRKINFNYPLFDRFQRVVFQFEMIIAPNSVGSDTLLGAKKIDILNKIVLTDVLGIKRNGHMYAPEPLDAQHFIDKFSALIEFSPKHNKRVMRKLYFPMSVNSDYRPFVLLFQKIVNFTSKEFESMKSDICDGYLLVSNNYEFRGKCATFDVRINNKQVYLDSSPEVIGRVSGDFFKPNAIYEVYYASENDLDENKLTVARLRHDRYFTSTELEMENCIADFKYLMELLRNSAKRRTNRVA